jgi:hypothetical protein
MMGVVPRAVTVWAVELGKDVQPDETRGTLELAGQALLFTPNDDARPAVDHQSLKLGPHADQPA